MTEAWKQGWARVKLRDVALERTERIENPTESSFERFVGSDDIGKFEWTVRRWRLASEVTSAAKVFQPGDYLFVRRSLYASDFRERAARASFAGICSSDILPLREKPGCIATGYLGAVLNSPQIWEYVVKHATGSITRRIKWRDLAEYEFMLPPLDEQRRAVCLLSGVFALAQELESAEVALQHVRDSLVMREFHSEEAKPTLPLEDACDHITVGIVVKPAGMYVERGVPALIMKHVQRGVINFSEPLYISEEGDALHRKSRLRAGDVVAVRSSGSITRTGDAAVVPEALDGANCVDLLVLRPNRKLEAAYLCEFLNAPSTRAELVGHSSGTMQKHLNVSAVKKLKMPSTPVEEQLNFLQRLKQLDVCRNSLVERRALVLALAEIALRGSVGGY